MTPRDGQPVRAVLIMTVPDALTDQFEQEWERVSHWVSHQDGCLRQTLSRSPSAEPTYVITSDWTDLPAFQRFERSGGQENMTARLRVMRRTARQEVLGIVCHREAPDRTGYPVAGGRAG